MTQNENKEKLAHPHRVIGKFGVGLKDALATFDRHKVDITLHSRNGQIIHQLQADVLDEIDEGTLEESSASTYVRCIKTLFNDTWAQLGIEPTTNPTLKLRAGSQQAVDFPLFRPEHVRALLRAASRPASTASARS